MSDGTNLISLPWDVKIKFPLSSLTTNYEQEAWEHITCPKKGVAIDVGAHYGFYTTKLSKEAGKKGHVYAFEPETRNLHALQRNLKLNSLKNVTVLKLALSDYDGWGKLFKYVGLKPRDTGQHFLRGVAGQAFWDKLKLPPPKPHRQVKVKVRKLDTVLEDYGLKRLDLIKMDVEGVEHLVLKGAKETIDRFSPKIVFEVHFGKKNNRLLKKLGYRLVRYIDKMTYTGNPLVVYSR